MNKNDKPSPLKIPAALISGAVQAGIGLIGGKKRKRALARAQGAYDMQKQRFENMDTSNPYANMENVYEDATINTQEADMIKQQQMQQQANVMDQFGAAAGGSGIAALAQAMSQQQSQNAQQAAASIGQQEQANQRLAMGEAGRIQDAKIKGDIMQREAEFSKIESMMNLTGQDLQKAQAEKAMHDKMAISGLGQMAGGALEAFTPLKK